MRDLSEAASKMIQTKVPVLVAQAVTDTAMLRMERSFDKSGWPWIIDERGKFVGKPKFAILNGGKDLFVTKFMDRPTQAAAAELYYQMETFRTLRGTTSTGMNTLLLARTFRRITDEAIHCPSGNFRRPDGGIAESESGKPVFLFELTDMTATRGIMQAAADYFSFPSLRGMLLILVSYTPRKNGFKGLAVLLTRTLKGTAEGSAVGEKEPAVAATHSAAHRVQLPREILSFGTVAVESEDVTSMLRAVQEAFQDNTWSPWIRGAVKEGVQRRIRLEDLDPEDKERVDEPCKLHSANEFVLTMPEQVLFSHFELPERVGEDFRIDQVREAFGDLSFDLYMLVAKLHLAFGLPIPAE